MDEPEKSAAAVRHRLRSLLSSLVTTDADLEAFCIDHFPEIGRRFSAGMDRVQKENLLLTVAGPVDLAVALRTQWPERFKQKEHLLGNLDLNDPTSHFAIRPYLLIETIPDRTQLDIERYYLSAHIAWQDWSGEYISECVLGSEESIFNVNNTNPMDCQPELAQPLRRADLETAFLFIYFIAATMLTNRILFVNLIIEIFVPRRLLNEAFEWYRKATTDTQLGCEHPVVLRSLERLEASRAAERIEHFRREGRRAEMAAAMRAVAAHNIPIDETGRRRERWNLIRKLKRIQIRTELQGSLDDSQDLGCCAVLHNELPSNTADLEKLWKLLNRPESVEQQTVSAVLGYTPSESPKDPDIFNSLIRSGLPIICWLRSSTPQSCQLLLNTLNNQAFDSLPEFVQKQRHAALTSNAIGQIGRDIVLLWDNPFRRLPTAFLRQPRRASQ